MACMVFWSWMLPGLYFNADIEQDGETVRLKDCVHHILDSPAYKQLKDEFFAGINIIREKGFEEFWSQLKEKLDIHGEQRSYEVLGLPEDASQKDIRSAYKQLVKQYHPDKCTGDQAKCEAKFQEIQKAYENLSSLEQKRQARNAQQTRGSRRTRK
eukprot:m.79929 g.79929  ORF g.79929 m.79929 type:complete len:156 (+) comp14644_c0_seq1:911-1378(+)